jgi:hypothetical protein
MRSLISRGVILACVVGASGGSTSASYVMTPVSNGATFLEITPGESFQLDIELSSSGDVVHNSAIFRVIFSEPGISYDGYSWANPYETGSMFDDSDPFIDELSVQLDASTLTGLGYPDEIVDVELSNVVAGGGVFAHGLLVSMDLTVPADFALGSVFIDLMPDTLANGFDEIPTTSVQSFELVVVPGPGALAFLALAGLARRSRRRI